MPNIGSLPLKRDVAFTNSDRTRNGDAFDAGLPNNHVGAAGGQLTFSPQADGAGDALGDYAFAGYSFVLKGYSDDGVVHFFWATPPLDGKAWVALANHQTQRWDWIAMPPGGLVDFGSMTPYLSQDNLTLMVIVGGTAPAVLAALVVGDDAVPAAFLDASPKSGNFPLTVNFTANKTTDSDGFIVKYEWDLDGDGTFELDTGSDLDTSKTFNVPGAYILHLRVTDDKGATSTDGVNVHVIDPDASPPSADLTATPDHGDYPLMVTLDASGSTDDQGVVNYDWDFDSDGVYDVVDSVPASIQHSYSDPGIYTATVRVEDASGSQDVASVQIDSNAKPTVQGLASPDCGADFTSLLYAFGNEPGGQIVQNEWDFEGDGVYDASAQSNQYAHTYNAFGLYHVGVRTTDDDGETATSSYDVRSMGTTAVQVATPDVVADGVSCAVVDGKLCCLYDDQSGSDRGMYFAADSDGDGSWDLRYKIIGWGSNSSNAHPVLKAMHSTALSTHPVAAFFNDVGDVMYARALVSLPLSASDWQVHHVQSSGGTFYFACSLDITGTLLTPRPAVSYYDDSDGELYFAYANVSAPSSESDWTKHIVDTAADEGEFLSLAYFGSVPHIAYKESVNVSGTLHERLKYARASKQYPTAASDWSIHIIDPDNVGGYISLANIGGLPAIAYDADNQINYATTSTLTPSSAADWSVTQIDSPSGKYPSLATIAGYPALTYTNTDGTQLKFAWAKDLLPYGYFAWCHRDLGPCVKYNSLCELNGKAEVVYEQTPSTVNSLQGK